MQYEIVSLPAITVRGLKARTSNTAPDMGAKIGGLWQGLYAGGAPMAVNGRSGENAYGIYTNYENGAQGEYDVVAGFAVAEGTLAQEGLDEVVIPAGRYARFSILADMQGSDVGDVWQEVWAEGLDRAFTADFEEYLPAGADGKTPVNIYIGLAG